MHTFLETLSENAQFVLLCLGITAGVLLLAWVSEKLVMRRRHRLNAAHTITMIAMLAAISGVLMVIEIPLFFAPSFYKLDFSELPVLICAFYLGPVSGVVCEFLKVLIICCSRAHRQHSWGSGELPRRLRVRAAGGDRVSEDAEQEGRGRFARGGHGGDDGVRELLQRLVPHSALRGHVRMPLEAIVSMGTQINGAITNLSTLVLLAVVPFNLLKGVLVSVLTFFLYKRVERLFFRKKHTA